MLLVVQLFAPGVSGCSGEAGLAEGVVDRGGERARLALRDAAIEADDDVGAGAWQVDVEYPERKRLALVVPDRSERTKRRLGNAQAKPCVIRRSRPRDGLARFQGNQAFQFALLLSR